MKSAELGFQVATAKKLSASFAADGFTRVSRALWRIGVTDALATDLVSLLVATQSDDDRPEDRCSHEVSTSFNAEMTGPVGTDAQKLSVIAEYCATTRGFLHRMQIRAPR